jgi:hypothetical protein
VDSPYYLLLRYDESNPDNDAIVCGTHREGVDDPSKLHTAPAYVRVDFDEYRLARESGEWRFRPDEGVYKEELQALEPTTG